MSATLKWKPVRPEGKGLSDAAKFLFRDNYGLNDGPIILDSSSIAWMNGASAASSSDELRKDLKVLIEAIEKFGSVELWQEF